MKKIFLFLVLANVCLLAHAQNKYWQQQVNVTINVKLNDQDNTLDGFETIEYINNSPDTLHYIWFHLWMNAYKNDRTAFSEQLLNQGRTDFYFSKPEQKGFISKLEFKADNRVVNIENDSANIDVIKLVLPTPLAPKQKTVITTPFHVKLPYNFSRGGYIEKEYAITQWFPKPAVYDHKGWHPMPYLNIGEFYSEFGNYDIEITAPSSYLVAATGVLQDQKTLEEIKTTGKHTIEGSTKTWRFTQDKVHDFAWFASKEYIAHYDTAVLASGKVVDVFSYYRPKAENWKNSIEYTKAGLKSYSGWIGDYPYSVVSVVQGHKNLSSEGMEYPTITLITTQDGGHSLDATIVHEVGHNWFYGALASNERQHPWMDEGMNTYYQKRYELEKYGTYSYLQDIPSFIARKLPQDQEALILATMAKIHKDQAIEAPSTAYNATNYSLIVYLKASRWMAALERALGRELFDKSMQQYYNDWKYKHPYPEDFKRSIESTSGKDLNHIFIDLHKQGPISNNNKKILKPTLLFNLNETDKYSYVILNPIAGYNHYDKLMVGGLVHNYQLPFPNVQFFAGAMYAIGSSRINPLGRISHTTYCKHMHFEKSLSYISYSQNDFVTAEGQKLVMDVKRLTPSLKLSIFDKDPNVSKRFTAHWQTFLINEERLNFSTVYTPTDTIEQVTTPATKYYVNRLTLTTADNRALYPYHYSLTIDQGKDFVRAGFTGKYFFNYTDQKSGLQARFFAGKFFYLTARTFLTSFQTDRYHLNMSGPKGYEDYTYSNYFVGRNEFDGWMSQQIMERDGFFKVRTDLLGNKVGKTDNWLMSLNLVSDLPDNINPLRVLPFRVPIKVFADIGTYAEAWRDNPATGRFLYDAGIQLPLFNSLVNIYIPILYSKVYSDYFKSVYTTKRFVRTLSFNINIDKLQPRQLIRDIPL